MAVVAGAGCESWVYCWWEKIQVHHHLPNWMDLVSAEVCYPATLNPPLPHQHQHLHHYHHHPKKRYQNSLINSDGNPKIKQKLIKSTSNLLHFVSLR